MLGYIIAIIALFVVIPLVFFLLRGGKPTPGPTAAETKEGSATIRQGPDQEQATSIDQETNPSRPSKAE